MPVAKQHPRGELRKQSLSDSAHIPVSGNLRHLGISKIHLARIIDTAPDLLDVGDGMAIYYDSELHEYCALRGDPAIQAVYERVGLVAAVKAALRDLGVRI